MGVFDKQAFMAETYNEATSTETLLVPEKEYAMLVLSDQDWTKWVVENTIKRGDRIGETLVKLVVPLEVQSQEVREMFGRDRVVVPYTCMLDFAPGTTRLDFSKGKNVQLGRLREAIGQNTDAPWNPGLLSGAGPLIGKVKHRSIDENDPSRRVHEVTSVGKFKSA